MQGDIGPLYADFRNLGGRKDAAKKRLNHEVHEEHEGSATTLISYFGFFVYCVVQSLALVSCVKRLR
jgi:hypothetical protein